MSHRFTTGIDVGTHQVKVVVLEQFYENEKIIRKVVATGIAPTFGMRHGYITNTGEVTESIKNAIHMASRVLKSPIDHAFISIGSIGLQGTISTGSIAISRADSEITDLDLENVSEACKNAVPNNLLINRKILHTIPINYKIDGKPVLGRPNGLKGSKLEVKTLFITCLEHHLNDLIQSIKDAGVEIDDVIASPLAASMVTLTKSQKIVGCVLANIGSETVSIVVHENGIPISLEVLPIGSNDITNDIALGLKIPLEEAESIKTGENHGLEFSKKKLDEIIEARLSDIFELIEAHLKKIGRSGLLPAGIILSGGGSSIYAIEDIAKQTLKLPSKTVGLPIDNGWKNSLIKDSFWSVAYGLCILGFTIDEDDSFKANKFKFVKKAKNSIGAWIKQFLP
ncbi:MAG: cell division protein FtsA [Candidatus Paceibacterota bacterium]